MEIGEVIKKYRIQRKLSQRLMAMKSGISNATISRIESGLVTPDTKTIQALNRALGVDLIGLLNKKDCEIENLPKGVWVPVYGEIAAGIPLECITDIVDYEQITDEMAKKGEYIALSVRGNSMAPRISSGDVVIIHLQPDIENGEIAAVMINGDSATLKRVKKSDEGLTLISLNPEFEPMFFTPKDVAKMPIRILGKMVELRAKF